MPTPKPLENYQSYKGIPPLAGLCSMKDALKPGLSVEECVRRLKRIHYSFVRLHQILTARITAVPIYELKTVFAHHAYLCAEHAAALRTRVGEMREPPLGLDEVPHPAVEVLFDEILAAPTDEMLYGLYGTVLGDLDLAIEHYLDQTHPLTDAPSRRVLRFARLELDDMMNWYADTTRSGEGPCAISAIERLSEWVPELSTLISIAGGTDGTAPVGDLHDIKRHHSLKPYVYDPVPQRDERFADPWNQGVNAEAFLYDERQPAKAKALMMLFKRLREIDVPEMMASIVAQTPGKPWRHYDLSSDAFARGHPDHLGQEVNNDPGREPGILYSQKLCSELRSGMIAD